jgi:hypothetical protein
VFPWAKPSPPSDRFITRQILTQTLHACINEMETAIIVSAWQHINYFLARKMRKIGAAQQTPLCMVLTAVVLCICNSEGPELPHS